jgi:hypothetical protein
MTYPLLCQQIDMQIERRRVLSLPEAKTAYLTSRAMIAIVATKGPTAMAGSTKKFSIDRSGKIVG